MIQLPDEEYVQKDGATHCTTLQIVKHTIGMDKRNCYTRHGKSSTAHTGTISLSPKREKEWYELVVDALAGCREYEHGVIYWLTRKGLDWLGKHIGVTIHDNSEGVRTNEDNL